ncbi:MAG: hypothetical protein QM751_03975 [Paludibacteraceae bacterium]
MSNIALSGLILLFLLLPGILFRAFMIRADSLENPLDTSFSTETGIILFSSICLNALGYFVATLFYEVDITQLYLVLLGNSDKIDFRIFQSSAIPFFIFYILPLSFFAILAAFAVRQVILNYFLDIRYSFLPVVNEWDKLLSGRYFEWNQKNSLYKERKEMKSTLKDLKKNEEKDKKKIETTNKLVSDTKVLIKDINNRIKNKSNPNRLYVDVLVSLPGGDMLYRGEVYKYFLGKDNSLEKIILNNVHKRPFNATGKGFRSFESNLFVIRYEDIKNLNVRYAPII